MWDGRESFFNPLGDEQTFAANLNAELAATNKTSRAESWLGNLNLPFGLQVCKD